MRISDLSSNVCSSDLNPCISRIAPSSDKDSILRPSKRFGADPRERTTGLQRAMIRPAVLLITFGEGIGSDQFRRLIDHVELPVAPDLAYACLAPQMVIGVDLDVAFRRLLELQVGRGSHDFVDIEIGRAHV